jgi:hypothetical protein
MKNLCDTCALYQSDCQGDVPVKHAIDVLPMLTGDLADIVIECEKHELKKEPQEANI